MRTESASTGPSYCLPAKLNGVVGSWRRLSAFNGCLRRADDRRTEPSSWRCTPPRKRGRGCECIQPIPRSIMPHIIVKIWPGKPEEQKRLLADRIARDVMDV